LTHIIDCLISKGILAMQVPLIDARWHGQKTNTCILWVTFYIDTRALFDKSSMRRPRLQRCIAMYSLKLYFYVSNMITLC
jgi:hypothetical protein